MLPQAQVNWELIVYLVNHEKNILKRPYLQLAIQQDSGTGMLNYLLIPIFVPCESCAISLFHFKHGANVTRFSRRISSYHKCNNTNTSNTVYPGCFDVCITHRKISVYCMLMYARMYCLPYKLYQCIICTFSKRETTILAFYHSHVWGKKKILL